MFSASWDLPSMPPGATTNADVTVPGARGGDFADASLDTSSIAFVLDCHVWSNDKIPSVPSSVFFIFRRGARLRYFGSTPRAPALW